MKARANKQRKEKAKAKGPGTAQQAGVQSGSKQQASGQASRQGEQEDNRGDAPQSGRMGAPEDAEIQQSAQREGMGSHRRHPRPNEQAIDATADVDSLGTHERGAAISRDDAENP